MGEGSVLADLSEEDLKEAYRQVGLDFRVPKWMWLEMRNQDLQGMAEHASAQRIQRWYRETKRRQQYEHNFAAKELRQQGIKLKAYLLQKVENAEEHGSQQERLLTATQQSCDQLKQQVQDQDQQLQVQRQHAAEDSEMNSAQLAKQDAELARQDAELARQDAELAAAKQELATCLAAHEKSERAAKDRSDQLRKQLDRRDIDLLEAKAQCLKLQEDLGVRRQEVIAEKQEKAALQRAHRASQKESELKSAKQAAELAAAKQESARRLAAHQDFKRECEMKSAQLAKQDAELAAAKQESVTRLAADKKEQAALQKAHHATLKEAQKHSDQLQMQLDQRVTEVGSLQHKLTSLDAEHGKPAKAKEVNAQEFTDLRNRVESRATKSQGRGQGFAARLAASGTSLKSDNSSGPSSPATPSDERPKGRYDVFTRLGPMPAPTSQAPSYQGTSWSDDDDGGEASAAPPGFGAVPSAKSGDGATTTKTPLPLPGSHSIPSRSGDGDDTMEPPPGFGPISTANTECLEYARQLRSFKATYCGPRCSLPTMEFMIPRIACIGDQLNDLHGFGLMHQAVHLDSLLVCEGEWELADTHTAASMRSSLEKSMVYAGIEAPEIAQQLHKAGYYHPDPKHDIWAFGLLLFFIFKGKGQLPREHQKAIWEGTTLLFASKLGKRSKHTEWLSQIEGTLKQGRVDLQLVKIVMGCLKRDPEERLTAAEVLVALGEFQEEKWCFSSTDGY